MRNGRLIILFVCILHYSGTFAQQNLNYSFRHITQQDGLLHNLVRSIAQDAKGFIWVSTSNGLQRYDGSRFIFYPEMLSNHDEELANGGELYADNKKNLLWVSKNNRIEKMMLGKNSFIIYDLEQLLNDTSFHYKVYTGFNNESWLLGNNALLFYNNIAKKYSYQQNIILPDNHKTSYVAADHLNGQIWVTTLGKILLFDEKTKKVYSGDDNPERHPLLQPSLYGTGEHSSRQVMVDSRNNVWVTTWGDRLYRYDPLTRKISTYFLSAIKSIQQGRKVSSAGLLINSVLEDDHYNIWVATESMGLLRYNRGKDNFDYCIAQEKNSESVQYNYSILTLFQDREENIWIGTDKGISIFNPYRQYFMTIRHEENNSLSLPKNEIDCFIQTTGGDIFIGTWGGGMAEYDKEFHFKKNIVFKGPVENNLIWSFLQYDKETLWIGCQHGYLLQYNMTHGVTKILHPAEMEGSTIRCMEKDSKGNIFFGLHNGKISKWDRTLNRFFSFGASQADSMKTTAVILNIFIDRADHCWVSTENGYKQFDLGKRIYIQTWLPDKKNTNSIAGKTFRGIEEYNDSTLLIGTIYGGINFFNKRTKTFSHLTTADGLPSNTIYAIKKDTAGYIWFTTEYGLYKFNPTGKTIIPFSIDPGLMNSSFTGNKFYLLQDGQWATFTATEVFSFLPRNLGNQIIDKPKTEITGFKLFDKPVFIDSLLFENKPIRLSYNDNFFTVEFSALNFSNHQQINYHYRLNGIDKDWVNGGTKRFANYTDLQPGEYVFNVKAENGNTSGEPASFEIIIDAPFWKTTWFRILCLAFISGLAYSFIHWRIRSIRNEAALKQKISESEMQALRAQMNPHFIFNSLNAIDNLIQTNQKDKATTYLVRFAKLIRSVLDSSKNSVVSFQKDYESLQLYLQMEQFRCNDKFVYELKADDELLQSDYKVPPLIIQPFVENAIHHGLLNKQTGDRKLSVSATLENDCIKYTVCDNGVGRIKANQINEINKPDHRSYGIDITKERIQLYNQNGKNNNVTFTDLFENNDPSGTKVEIRLKIYDTN